MKSKIQVLCGPSASGKSTYAKSLVDTQGYIRLNRDDFRKSLINTSLKEYWTGPKEYRNIIENLVSEMLNASLSAAMKASHNIVVDNTHLQARYISDILKVCKANCGPDGFEYLVKRFDVSVDTCIDRDKNREDAVGEQVIRHQEEQFKKFKYEKCNQWVDYVPYKFEPLIFDQTKPKCLIVDIDNTVAKMGDRSPFDWKRVGEDEPKQQVIDIVNRCRSHIVPSGSIGFRNDKVELVFMSGRDAVCREETTLWLKKYFGDSFKLFMRPQNDMRPDDIIKYEILKNDIAPHYFPIAVFDDRQKVVDMERKIGLQVFQCEEGNF